MSRVVIPVVDVRSTGLNLIENEDWIDADHTDGHKFDNSEGTVILLARGVAADNETVNILTTYQRDNLDLESRDIETAFVGVTSDIHIIGSLRRSTFNVTTGADKGFVYFDVAGATDMQFAAIKI
jgi:hypothetical protein